MVFWLYLIAYGYFVYHLVWILTDYYIGRVLDIFILELNCILIVDYIGYFKLEDDVFLVLDVFLHHRAKYVHISFIQGVGNARESKLNYLGTLSFSYLI